MKHNEDGIAHLQFIVLGVLVLSVIGFAAFRVGQSTQSYREAQEIKSPEAVQDLSIKEAEEKPAEEVAVPAEEKEIAAAPTPAPAPAPKTQTTTKTEVKKEKIYVDMTKVSAVQNGAVLNVHSRLASAQSGTCNFKLWQDGYEKVYSSVQISNSVDCIGQLSLSGLPTYSGWSLHVWFDGSDGVTFGYQKEELIALSAP